MKNKKGGRVGGRKMMPFINDENRVTIAVVSGDLKVLTFLFNNRGLTNRLSLRARIVYIRLPINLSIIYNFHLPVFSSLVIYKSCANNL